MESYFPWLKVKIDLNICVSGLFMHYKAYSKRPSSEICITISIKIKNGTRHPRLENSKLNSE